MTVFKSILFSMLVLSLNASAYALTCQVEYKNIGKLDITKVNDTTTNVMVNNDVNSIRSGDIRLGITVSVEGNGIGLTKFHNLKSIDDVNYQIVSHSYWTNSLHDGMKMHLIETVVTDITCK